MARSLLGGAAFGASLLLAAAAHATCSPIPFVFQPGTPWNASQVNANFTAVIDCANSSTGNMRGPNSSTSGAAVIWDSTDGTLTANTAMDGYSSVMAVPPGVIAGLVPGWNTTTGIGFRKRTATSTDGNNVLIARDAEFTGGTPGFVNAALQVATHTVPGINSYEWAGLFYIDNNGTQADGSQDNALYARALKKTTGSTWAATFELDDYNSSVASGSPVAVEMDVYANGADPSSNRTILHLVGNKLDPLGTAPDIHTALKIGAGPGTTNIIGDGIEFVQGTTFTTGISFVGAVFNSAALWMGDDEAQIWDTAGNIKSFWNSGTSCVDLTRTAGNLLSHEFCNTGNTYLTDGTVKIAFQPSSGSSAGILATATDHDLVLQRNSAERLRATTTGINVTGTVSIANDKVFELSGTGLGIATGAALTTISLGNGTATVQLSAPAGTAANYVCADVAGNIFIQAGAC